MQHPAASEISVEVDGFRLTLRVESSLEDYERTYEGRLGACQAREFARLLHGSLAASLPELLRARDQVSSSLSRAYSDLQQEELAMLPAGADRSSTKDLLMTS